MEGVIEGITNFFRAVSRIWILIVSASSASSALVINFDDVEGDERFFSFVSAYSSHVRDSTV